MGKQRFSLLEVMVALGLLSILATIAFSVISLTVQASTSSSEIIGNELNMERALDRIILDLETASRETITPVAGSTSSELRFQKVNGITISQDPNVASEITLADPVSFKLVAEKDETLGNQIDDNKNGIIDEANLVLEIEDRNGNVDKTVALKRRVTRLSFSHNATRPYITIFIDAVFQNRRVLGTDGKPVYQTISITRTVPIRNP
jgi:prepilin-type N-terminal cleavage/methylation domain-containing protein